MSFYLLDQDLDFLVEMLSNDREIAFIIPVGDSHWRTVDRIAPETLQPVNTPLNGPRYFEDVSLWHVPGGPLHHFHRAVHLGDVMKRGRVIENPEAGWTAVGSPFEPGTETLLLQLRVPRGNGLLPLSHLQWVGNHYSILGKRATASTMRWWNKLKRWSEKHGARISRLGRYDAEPPRGLAAYALPSALAAIREGRARSEN